MNAVNTVHIVPAAFVDMARIVSPLNGYRPSFALPLSPNGEGDATHWATVAYCVPADCDAMCCTGIDEVGNYTPAQISAYRDAMKMATQDVENDHRNPQEFFEAFAETLGLMRILPVVEE